MKFAAIADWADSGAYPVEFMCAELGVSRSGYYAWRGRGASDREHTDAGLLAVITSAHDVQCDLAFGSDLVENCYEVGLPCEVTAGLYVAGVTVFGAQAFEFN
ncbi:MAG: hypothetical protein M3P93_04125 [Actinomycetota bacterium]|nr:hypothetical protein [Actinomycetota bacterium]